jgi:hypothetical protein
MSKGVLYIGMDESNHGETKHLIGEIIVASCSFNKMFWEPKKHPNRRDYSQIEASVERGVNYFFTIVPHEIAKKNYSNLPLVAPLLIKQHFLSLKEVREGKLGLDGRLSREDKEKLILTLEEMGIEMTVMNFIKKNGVHYGPKLIYLSHLIANNLLHMSMLQIAENEHYTPLNILNI